jgi:hypothetical protein
MSKKTQQDDDVIDDLTDEEKAQVLKDEADAEAKYQRELAAKKKPTTHSTEPNWEDPNLTFPRPEDAPIIIGTYAFCNAAAAAAITLYLDGNYANKGTLGGKNFYTWPDGSVHQSKPVIIPPGTGDGSGWAPADSYPSSVAMVLDLMHHHFPNQVLLDGGTVVQFANGFGPPIEYWTWQDGSVKRVQPQQPPHPPTDLPGQPPTVGGMVVLPWGGEVRTGVNGAPQMGGNDIYMLSLTVPGDWPVGPSSNLIVIAEHNSPSQQRRVKLYDGAGTQLYTSLDTNTNLPYTVGGAPVELMPGGTYTLSVQNEGPNPPPTYTNFVAHCYTPAR